MIYEDQWKELAKMEADHIAKMAKLRDSCAAFALLVGIIENSLISFIVCQYLHWAAIAIGSIGMLAVTYLVIEDMLFYQRDHRRIVKESLERRHRHLEQSLICRELGI